LPSNDRYILIDTGYDYEWELFIKKLAKNNITIGQISHVILTHHHDDHAGLLNNIISENKNVKIIMSELSPELLVKGKNDTSHGGWLVNKRIDILLKFKMLYLSIVLGKKLDKDSNFTFPPYNLRKEDIIINLETKLNDIGIDINGKIILTPEHTIDSISILLENGIVFAGDAVANFLQFVGTKYCVIFITDLDEYYKTWEYYISENVSKIFPAHGNGFAIDKLKKYIRRNKKEDMVKFM
jgi:glyoxylase-like metal-dependent hydrolase (beta-lactamase superfamily II)